MKEAYGRNKDQWPWVIKGVGYSFYSSTNSQPQNKCTETSDLQGEVEKVYKGVSLNGLYSPFWFQNELALSLFGWKKLWGASETCLCLQKGVIAQWPFTVPA